MSSHGPAAIVDGPGDTFVLLPNPLERRYARRQFTTLLVFVYAIVVAGLINNIPHISWPVWVVVLVVFGASEWMLWIGVVRLMALKAGSTDISSAVPLTPQRMPRADLAFIMRGQVLRPWVHRTYWEKSYVFATSAGKIGMALPSKSFTDEGMTEFARRLQVPIRGDFSTQVIDRVDLPPR